MDWERIASSSQLSSDTSIDEDEVNYRLAPHWPAYQSIFSARGVHLDTVRDVKEFYSRCGVAPNAIVARYLATHVDDALCPDPGLPDNLFRGARSCDGTKVVVKAVHRKSRERDIIGLLSSPQLRKDPKNHCIPVIDIIDISSNAFIVMEEWFSPFNSYGVCCPSMFLAAVRQLVEHIVFMHKLRIAHLDISVHNLLTDCKGHYAYIDFELGRRIDGKSSIFPTGRRGTEIPPEYEESGPHDPYKVDVFALGVVIVRALQSSEFHMPELTELLKAMLHKDPYCRPTASCILQSLDVMATYVIDSAQLHSACSCTSNHYE